MNNQDKDERIIALLIDGDHTPAEYIDAIEQFASISGRVTHKRLYYTYNKGIPNDWESKLNPHSLRPVQVMPYARPVIDKDGNATVKNVADAALIIDAMDIMYQGTADTVFIVASDSDYTMIAKRLKESGIYIIGAGKKITAQAFIKACDEFKYLEKLQEEYFPEKKTAARTVKGKGGKSAKTADEKKRATEDYEDDREEGLKLVSKQEIENYIIRLFESQGRTTISTGAIMLAIRRRYPTFDCKDYGAKKFHDFFDARKFKVINYTTVQYPAVLKED